MDLEIANLFLIGSLPGAQSAEAAAHETGVTRKPAARVHPQFLNRWSSRAFSERPLSQALLDSLFEAARWAPSASNAQPALFIYADTPEDLKRFRPLLRDSNRRWADRAPVLAFLFAKKTHQGSSNRCATFDAGAAWMSLALQAHELGLNVRAMGGIHREQVHLELNVPTDEYEVACGLAIGYRGDPSLLPAELQNKEQPNTRRPLAEVAVRGHFPTR
jgi:nitroreductase